MSLNISPYVRWVLLLCFILLFISCEKKPTESQPKPLPPITDLRVTSFEEGTIILEWTSPINDSTTGPDLVYDIRYSKKLLTEENWHRAYTLSNEPAPLPANGQQQYTIRGFDRCWVFHFAIKTSAGQDIWSEISNVPSGSADHTPPSAITDLLVYNLNSDTIFIRWTAPADPCTLDYPAAEYDLRYSTSTITEINWDQCASLGNNVTPRNPGVAQTAIIVGDGIYRLIFFAMKSSDLTGNWSAISNVISVSPADVNSIVYFPDPALEKAIRAEIGIITGVIHDYELLEIFVFKSHWDRISNITGLEHCHNLEVLELRRGKIVDLTPLADLVNLKRLEIWKNKVVVIEPLTNLINLEYLSLFMNEITDIAPLVANTGLGEGDTVTILYNPLSEQSINEYIPALRARGVLIR